KETPPAPKIIEAKPQPKDDAAERLKSSLAKAREEAAEAKPTPAPLPKPVVHAAPPAPAPVREELARVRAPAKLDTLIWDDPVIAQQAKPAAPVLPVTLEKKEEAPAPKKYVPLPPADVEITPLKPKKAPEGKTVPLKPQGFGTVPSPIMQDEIRELPPAMPPALKPTLSVSADPTPPAQYITVIPSVGQPTQKFSTTAAAPARPRKLVDFRPLPVSGTGSWGTRVVEPQGGDKTRAFCLMEN